MSIISLHLTWGATVGTGLVAWHVPKLSYDGPRELLEPAVLEVELVSSQRRVQGLLFAVLQH